MSAIESSSTTTNTTTQKASTNSFDVSTLKVSDFETVFLKSLGGEAKAQVNEEEVFASLVKQGMESLGTEQASHYQELAQGYRVSLARADGVVSEEAIANAALEEAVADGTLDSEYAESLKGAAFRAAQLDDNLTALYDSRGSAEDPTIAVSETTAALSKLAEVLDKMISGELTYDSQELGDAQASTGTTTASAAADGSGGFLWKPVSDSDGNLVVLLPSELNGLIDRVEIHSDLPPTEQTKLGSGRFTGVANGDRSHFRFEQPGAEFGQNVHVVVYKDSGETVTFDVADGSERID